MKSTLLLIKILVLTGIEFVSAISCAHTRIEDFPFIDSNGASIDLYEKPSFPPGEEGRLILHEGKYTTPLYTLKHAANGNSRNMCFFLNYSGLIKGEIVLYYGEDQKRFFLPAVNAYAAELVFPLEKEKILTGFNIESEAQYPQWKIKGVGLRPKVSGIRIENNIPVVSESFKLNVTDDKREFLTELHSAEFIFIEYFYDKKNVAGNTAYIRLYDEFSSEPFDIVLLPGKHSLFIPAYHLKGKVTAEDNGSTITKFDLVDNKENYADLGLLINDNTKIEKDYNIFRWTEFPDILLIDAVDYEVQSALFKRLAYFVEKRGYAGTILTDEMLDGLHGWNAHDYRAEDLSRFFNEAETNGITLNTYEIELRNLLIREGIINKQFQTYGPAEGGILSVSRESPPYLRELFLAHEGYHGIFFSEPGFERFVIDLYSTLNDEELKFWNLFLGWKGYDISNEYLMANELQAYLLQIPIERNDAYYKEYVIPNMIEKFPEYTDYLLPMTNPDYSWFYDTALKIHSYIESTTGYGAGNLFSLRYRKNI